MNDFVIKGGVKIARTPQYLANLEALRNLKDEDIDCSDIPEITAEELKKFRPARLRRKNLKIAG